MDRKILRKVGWLLISLALGAWLYHWRGEEAAALLSTGLSEEGDPVLFLLMFALLPPFGFPLSAFLVLLGIKFGGFEGVLIMTAGMPIHLLAAFLVAHSFLRERVRKILEKTAYRLPRVPSGKSLGFSLLFMAVPGLPYSIKNLFLAFSGVPFRHFFVSGFLVQGAMGIPFVLAGEALAGRNLLLLAAFLLAVLGIYAVIYGLRKRHAAAAPEEDAGAAFDGPGARKRGERREK